MCSRFSLEIFCKMALKNSTEILHVTESNCIFCTSNKCLNDFQTTERQAERGREENAHVLHLCIKCNYHISIMQ